MNEERIERWVEGADDAEIERQMLADPAMAEDAYALAELDAALTAAVARRRRHWAKPRPWALGLVAAAALAFAVFGPLRESEVESTRLRGDATGSLELLAPRGEWDHFPRRFVWKGAAADSYYRWELYDGEARTRAIEIVADTVLLRSPDETPADSVGTWRWLVVEIAADGSEGAISPPLHFEVRTP